jgi:hypothetical protein
MAVETIGEALSYGWRVTAPCAAGKQDGMVRHPECRYREESLLHARTRSQVARQARPGARRVSGDAGPCTRARQALTARHSVEIIE